MQYITYLHIPIIYIRSCMRTIIIDKNVHEMLPSEIFVNVGHLNISNEKLSTIFIFFHSFAGLKSYGKIVYVFSVLPIFGMTLLCAKLLGFLPNTSKSHNFFPETDWSEFFLNSKVMYGNSRIMLIVKVGFLSVKVSIIPLTSSPLY